ncbi:MAG TPA: hypothetical protein VFU62_08000 [Hanamia sp.]|nr:hypothetical protein [Hanamia sp.]
MNEFSLSEISELTRFFSAIAEDPRIGTTHISLYMALFQFYNLNGFQNPVLITRSSVMKVAKINGIATYHRCIKDLQECGYILYEPSFNSAIGSKIYLIRV